MSSLDELRAKRAELDKQIAEAEEAERKAKGRKQALSDIAAMAAFKALFARLKASEGLLPEIWHNIPGPSLPREGTLARNFDISETDTHNAKERGVGAVKGL